MGVETRARGGAGRWGCEFVCVWGVGPLGAVLFPFPASFGVLRVGMGYAVGGVSVQVGSRHKLAVLIPVSGFGVGDGGGEMRDSVSENETSAVVDELSRCGSSDGDNIDGDATDSGIVDREEGETPNEVSRVGSGFRIGC